jgi:hypothetical protein
VIHTGSLQQGHQSAVAVNGYDTILVEFVKDDVPGGMWTQKAWNVTGQTKTLLLEYTRGNSRAERLVFLGEYMRLTLSQIV